MPEACDSLAPQLRAYVDALLAHAGSALWPERRAALESFQRGIAGSPEEDLRAAAEALGLDSGTKDDPAEEDPADLIFRRVLTAYLSCLGEEDNNNPDQAHLFSRSLDPGHRARAEHWLAARAEADGES